MSKSGKRERFHKIAKDIKDIKIQGASNIAKKALYAYFLIKTKTSKKKLLSLRPTEPMLKRALDEAEKNSYGEVLKHFESAQDQINKNLFRLIKFGDVVFTHCHSTNVIGALIYTHNNGKKFQVYNTETRPLFQGRKTARELKKAGISVTMFVDSALGVALSHEQKTKKVDKIFIGADAILKDGIYNKIGSEVIAQIAKNQKIPVYVVSDSWKYSNFKVSSEQRDDDEVWQKAPKNLKIKNPAFEFVEKKYIKGIISELGVLSYSSFLKKVEKK